MAADKILIVDDDAAVLKMLTKVVKSNGLDSDAVESGEEAFIIVILLMEFSR